MSHIAAIHAREVLDSRAILRGSGSISGRRLHGPGDRSQRRVDGEHEAVELRDDDTNRSGQGVLKAVEK